jgi:hypothetical protein
MEITRRRMLGNLVAMAAGLAFSPRTYAGESDVRESNAKGNYAVLVRKSTLEDGDWGKPVQALQDRYDAKVIDFDKDVRGCVTQLKQGNPPKYVAWVAKPEELAILELPELPEFPRLQDFYEVMKTVEKSGASKFYHLLDAVGGGFRSSIGGIITGRTSEDALALATQEEDFEMGCGLFKTLGKRFKHMQEGVYYSDERRKVSFSDGRQEERVIKKVKSNERVDESSVEIAGPEFLKLINTGKVDLIVTSGHGSSRDWNVGYNYADSKFYVDGEGKIRVTIYADKEGKIRVTDPENPGIEGLVTSKNPKVYWAAGNCQTTRIIDPKQSFALAWMQNGGVIQFLGYLSYTWCGVAGWGLQDHLFNDDGVGLAEAFFMNSLAIQHYKERFRTQRVEGPVGKDEFGHMHDERATVLYGNPALNARIARDPNVLPLLEKNVETSDRNGKKHYKFSVVVRNVEAGEELISPPVFLLPQGIGNVEEGSVKVSEGLKYRIGRDFVVLDPNTIDSGKQGLVLKKVLLEKGQTWELEFVAE